MDIGQDVKNNNDILRDYGPGAFVVEIDKIAEINNNYRTALWTGKYIQLTLMSIKPNESIGLEMHPDTDQIIFIVKGKGMVKMGDTQENMTFESNVFEDCAIFVPAGKWHNVMNTGRVPMKIYTVYAPPHHPHGTIQTNPSDIEKEMY